jgi:putative phosphoesterase
MVLPSPEWLAMRILILADIHGNWPALQAIQEPHDACLVVGDLVDYGPEPGPCIDWVRRQADLCIRGNHDHAVAQRAASNGKNGFKYLTGITRQLTWQLLSSEQMRYLASLPVTRMITLAKKRFFLVHGTPRDPLDEYAMDDPELWERRLRQVEADIICVGHTHLPYVLPVGQKLVINPGSVGQPRDGDPRASYAIWEDGNVELKRVSYPIEDLVKSVEASHLPEQAKRISIEVFRSGANNFADLAQPVAS